MSWGNNAADKKGLILNAADSCLKKTGLHQLNIRDIAREAGVSLGSIHYYFESKEHILMEIFRKFIDERILKTTAATALSVDADARQKILGVIDVFIDQLGSDLSTCRIFIDLWSQIAWHGPLRGLLDAYYRLSTRWLTGLIQEGKDQGLFSVSDPEMAASQIVAVVDGLMVQINLFGPELDMDRLKRSCKEFVNQALNAG